MEIKFRTWIFKEKKMKKVYGLCWQKDILQVEVLRDEILKEGLENMSILNNPNCFEYWINEKECIIMRYTERKDKNGKEIYEGDIVKVKNIASEEEAIGFIQFNSRRGYYEIVFDNSPAGTEVFENYTFSSWEIEVIGNIYENPNLLKKGE